MSHRKPFLIGAAAALLGLLVTAAPGVSTANSDTGPNYVIPRGWTGAEAADALRNDHSLRIGTGGRLYYEDQLSPEAAAAAAVAQPEQAALAPLADTFTLHSRPGSSKTIYLDFNGNTALNSLWSFGSNAQPNPLVSSAMDLDGTPGSFSDDELTFIQNVWSRVADDYDMFDVDVTTQEPAPGALVRDNFADTTYGTRVVITNSNFTGSALGIAYVGIFGTVGLDTPAFVFTYMSQFGIYGIPYAVAHGITHEVGHTLGLHHDGTVAHGSVPARGYFGGYDSRTWAPVMGSAGGSQYVTWSKGEYQWANNAEDDLVVMEEDGEGVARLPDVVGNTTNTATALTVNGSALTGSGRIETRTDVDLWSFDVADSRLNLTVSPAAPLEPNLDLEVKLLDVNGNPVANGTANPADRGAPSLSLTLPAGRYYLRIDGVGQGSALVDGYSDYASLGRYTISATLGAPPPPPNQPPSALATVTNGATMFTKQFSSAGSSDPEGQPLSYSWTFGDSTTSTEANPVHVYAQPGVYTVKLTVTDAVNQTGTMQLQVTIGDPAKQLRISSVVGARVSRGTVRVRVTVVDGFGKPVKGASVRGVWAGTTTNRSATTNSSGVATFYRYTSKAAAFTTNRVTRTGRTWDGINGSTGVTAYVR